MVPPPNNQHPRDPDEGRLNGMDIIRRVTPYLWPQGAPKIRSRVLLSLLLLLLSKLIALGAPQLYGRAVAGRGVCPGGTTGLSRSGQ